MPTNNRSLYFGWATVDITPPEPVALAGQYYARVSQYVRDPITATALAVEGIGPEVATECAIIVSCDLVRTMVEIQARTRELLAARLPDFDPRYLVLCATHIHTGPLLLWEAAGRQEPATEGVMPTTTYVELLCQRLCDVAARAWKARRPGSASWALGHAVVGHNRRTVYFDGTAQMYGSTNTPSFDSIEGDEDHGVEMLFTWDAERKLSGMALDVACPAQVMERHSFITADYWGEVRKRLADRYGVGLFVLPLIGAAGDQSPRDLVRRGRGEADMHDEAGMLPIARRIARAVEHALAKGPNAIAPIFAHRVKPIELPIWQVTEAEVEKAKAAYAELAQHGPYPPASREFVALSMNRAVLQRHADQQARPTWPVELHVLRLGDVAYATNPFELYLDYGWQIKARSKALQTSIIQLAGGMGWYLPTAKAAGGAGYSARVEVCKVGPEGGGKLVEETVELVNSLWD